MIYLSRALPTLQKFNVQLYTLNCQISEAKICKSPTEEAQTLHLYKYELHVYVYMVLDMGSIYNLDMHEIFRDYFTSFCIILKSILFELFLLIIVNAV